MHNTLFFGDNLDILREHLADESIDLIYLDPPFNSKRDYNSRGSTGSRKARVEVVQGELELLGRPRRFQPAVLPCLPIDRSEHLGAPASL